jgi:NhaP-type Na+/H+ and K+/H+ antiporter
LFLKDGLFSMDHGKLDGEACLCLFLSFDQLLYFTLQVSDEAKYIKSSISDRTRQLEELHARMDENSTVETTNKKAFEDEIQNSLNSIVALDDSRRAAQQLVHEEEEQNVAVCWFLYNIYHLF